MQYPECRERRGPCPTRRRTDAEGLHAQSSPSWRPYRGWLPGLALLCLAALGGCADPAEQLAAHLDAMAKLAETEPNCALAAQSLQSYLDQHQSDFRSLATRHGESSPEAARKVDTAALRLDSAVQPCAADAGMQTFSRRFSSIVLESL